MLTFLLITIAIILIANLLVGIFIFINGVVSQRLSGLSFHLDPRVMTGEKFNPKYQRWYQAQAWQSLHLTSRDQLQLAGWYLPHPTPTTRLVILIHPYMANHQIMAAYAQHYHQAGFNIFLADNRGNGQSEGVFIGTGWLDRLDYLDWIKLLIARQGKKAQVVVHGVSMGGATTLNLCGEKLPKQVRALIADCAFDSTYNEYHHQTKQRLGIFTIMPLLIANALAKLLAGYSFKEANPIKQVSHHHPPLLIIHGADDTFNPVAMGKAVYRAASEPKQLWIVPGAQHAKAFDVNPRAYFAKVKKFCSQCLDD